MIAPASTTSELNAAFRSRAWLYISVGLVAGAVIALQIGIMRIFSVGSWAHFGSFVVSLAMLGFGLTSAVMCVASAWFDRHWKAVAAGSLFLFGPLAVGANLIAQQIPFNAIFLLSDPAQKWRLFGNFMLYLLPFLSGAVFLGVVFLKARDGFGRVYFADLTGSGLTGLVFLAAMYGFLPEDLIIVPLAVWLVGAAVWFLGMGNRAGAVIVALCAVAALSLHLGAPSMLGLTKLATSDYKGVAYARKFPDAQRVYERSSPFGQLEVYSSSYLHFAPGLSDNAAFNLTETPANAYLGLYIDGEGPNGIIAKLPDQQTAYFRYLPMVYPYVLKKDADTFVVQFGGGISTTVALRSGSRHVTVAEGNPAVLDLFRHDPTVRKFTGDILADPRISVVDYDGRLFLAATNERYDVIDLSLADSAGLSNPGGFAIVEKYGYTREAMLNYMRALKPGGILSVTLWNKEEPPKSVLKLYATMAAAAREYDAPHLEDGFFVVSSYLSTTTVLYKRGGFTADEIKQLRDHTHAMSFDEIYYKGFQSDAAGEKTVLDNYRASIFSAAEGSNDVVKRSTVPGADATAPNPTAPIDPAVDAAPDAGNEGPLPATRMGQLTWRHLVAGDYDKVSADYVFDTRALTNARPYFAAYVRPGDLPRVLDRLEIMQDEWGYLLLWATLGIACITATSLILIPVVFGWRAIFSRAPGKMRTIIYFACLGLGYIMVEVGLISHFILALSNATVSASVLITGMLVFSGLGSFASEKVLPHARRLMPFIFVAIGGLLIGYGLMLDHVLDLIGSHSYWVRLIACFGLILPPAFLMGMPMPVAMATLARLGKEPLFLWAWGINGCFSVVGAAVVPIVATAFGLHMVLIVAGIAYLIAIPSFFAILKPMAAARTA